MENEIQNNIKEFGYHIVLVLPDHDYTSFGYTVGLEESFNHPEILISGLSENTSAQILKDIASDISNGKQFKTQIEYLDVLYEMPCVFIEVKKEYFNSLFGRGIRYYNGYNFNVLQCVWPDRNKFFPWQTNFDPALKGAQKVYGNINL